MNGTPVKPEIKGNFNFDSNPNDDVHWTGLSAVVNESWRRSKGCETRPNEVQYCHNKSNKQLIYF